MKTSLWVRWSSIAAMSGGALWTVLCFLMSDSDSEVWMPSLTIAMSLCQFVGFLGLVTAVPRSSVSKLSLLIAAIGLLVLIASMLLQRWLLTVTGLLTFDVSLWIVAIQVLRHKPFKLLNGMPLVVAMLIFPGLEAANPYRWGVEWGNLQSVSSLFQTVEWVQRVIAISVGIGWILIGFLLHKREDKLMVHMI